MHVSTHYTVYNNILKQDEPVEVTPSPPYSPHEKTPEGTSTQTKELTPVPLPPMRPPPQQRPHSTFEAGSAATLPLRPLSTNIDASTGDFIYDKLPETLPRPPKSYSSSAVPLHPAVS